MAYLQELEEWHVASSLISLAVPYLSYYVRRLYQLREHEAMLSHYRRSDMDVWTGRIDSTNDSDGFRIHQVVRPLDLNTWKPQPREPGSRLFCLLGFACDAGVARNQGRRGAVEGPAFIRKALANLPAAFPPEAALYDAGDIFCDNEDLEEAQQALAEAVSHLLDLGMMPLLLGGGHEAAYGHYHGIFSHAKQENPSSRIGIINFDAHFDLRSYPEGGHSGSSFLQIADECRASGIDFSYMVLGIQPSGNSKALFQTANDLGVEYVLAEDMGPQNQDGIREAIRSYAQRHDLLYLTLCMDMFAAAAAPGVSAPQPLGMAPQSVLPMIREVIKSEKVISLEIAEVSPPLDMEQRTSKLAAALIWELLSNV